MMTKLVKGLKCNSCQAPELYIMPLAYEGMATKLQTKCGSCGVIHAETFTSGRVPSTRAEGHSSKGKTAFEVNCRAVASAVDTGIGYAGLKQMCSMMNMLCMHSNAYDTNQRNFEQSLRKSTEQNLEKSAAAVREFYRNMGNKDIKDDDIVDISIRGGAPKMKINPEANIYSIS